MASSTYTANKVLELLVGKTAFATPTASLGVSTADPTADGSGIAEPTDAAYAQVETAGSDWAAAAAGAIANAAAISFPEATESWGTITHFFLVDGSDNLLAYGALTASKAVSSGEILRFPIGELTGTIATS